MTAMTESRRVRTRKGEIYSRGVAANAVIFQGALVCLSGGLAVPASTALNLIPDGVAREVADNSGGADSAIKVETMPQEVYVFNSAGADEVTIADIGSDCFLVDDQTVAKTDGGGTRSVAGKVKDVDDRGVLLRFGIEF